MKLNLISEAFNDDLNYDISSNQRTSKGTITAEGIRKLNDDLNEEIIGELEETLNRKKSLSYHYKKHVLKIDEERRSYNRGKYDYMTSQEYYEYAKTVRDLQPTDIIDKTITDKAVIEELLDNYLNSSDDVLVIDYELTNKLTGRPMYAVFNRNSKHSRYQEVCLVDKESGEPITLYVLLGNRFAKLMNDFLN